MFPSWGNYGAPPPQSFGGPGPRKPPIGTGQAPGGFGGYEASSSGSLFSSLQEQHRQQMQQLQMLHQKQLQSVLHHGNSGTGFGGGLSGGFNAAPPWHSEGPGQVEGAENSQQYIMQEKTPVQTPRGPLPPNQGQQPQPPPQPQPAESKPIPPPPIPQPPKSQENIGAPVASNTNPSSTNDNKSVPLQSIVASKMYEQLHKNQLVLLQRKNAPIFAIIRLDVYRNKSSKIINPFINKKSWLKFSKTHNQVVSYQDQQNVWYKQHLQNLQKLRQEKAQQNQTAGNAFLTPQPPSQAMPPPPPSEPPKGTPPPPPPREEPPVPPPPPVEVAPDAPKDPEEAARLQQLQAAAAQWQQVQQQRVSLQYQALMQQHEKLQQILEQYQRLIQQPPNLQTMSAELQLRHYEMQHQQFIPLFQNWNSSFALWHEQFQSYPHKDQLQDYELQWKQWQEQMNATNAHLQERVATITAMVPFASGQYGAMMGQLGQYPGQDMPLQQQVVNPGVQPTVVGAIATAPGPAGAPAASTTGATAPDQQPPIFVAHSESSDGPLVQGSVPGGVGVIPPGPLTMQTSSFNSIREPRPQYEERKEEPPPAGSATDLPGSSVEAATQGTSGANVLALSQRQHEIILKAAQELKQTLLFDVRALKPAAPESASWESKPAAAVDYQSSLSASAKPPVIPKTVDYGHGHEFSCIIKFEQFLGSNKYGPQRFDQPRQRFDGPQRFDQPRQRFDGPPRFDQPRHRFDNPPRHDQPNFGQQSRLDSSRPPCPPPRFESPSAPQLKQQQGPEPKLETDIQNPASSDSTTLPKTPAQPLSNKDESILNKSTADDLTDDNLLGSDGFFIQNDPIPQTLKSKKESEEAKNKTDDSNKDKPSTSTKDSGSVSKPPPPPQNSQKDDGPMMDNKKSIKTTAEIQPELQSSDQLAPKPEPPNLLPGRGRGQPPLRGLGRGQLGPGQFREHNIAQTEEGVGLARMNQSRGGPPVGRGGAHMGIGGPAVARGDVDDMHWAEAESAECSEEGEQPYWEEWRPQMRGMRPPFRPHHEGYEEAYKEDQALDYDRGEGEYRRPPAPEFPPEDYRHEAKFREGEWDRDRPLPEREYPPRMPPPPHLREERWDPETERRRSYPYDENDRARGELRILDYRDEPPYRLDEPPHLRASDWDRPSRRSPLPVRTYPDYGDLRPQYEERKEEPPPAGSATDLPGSSVEAATQGTSGANVLALSQRQHEIILKAAQELKQIRRELQEGKTPSTEKPQPASSDLLTELPAGLLGLEIPPDVRNVLKVIESYLVIQNHFWLYEKFNKGKKLNSLGMSAAVQPAAPESASWESKPAAAVDYQSSLSASAKPPVIPKTVDYGHGHELGATVERIAYGERIVLRPDPIPSDRLYDKEPLSLRDSYSRDPYYDRRPDTYLDRREYSRERELYRDAPPEYERDRYERERYHSRERDERSPLPPRAAYRERDKERSGSRDPDDYYGRPGYDRPLYDRSGPDRIGLERRGYPEDRGPHPAAPLPPPPTPPPPRVEKKPEIKNIDDILKAPGRLSRPERIVIIMRGLPGSGKSHVAKLIRDKEVESGGAPPRVLVLDDYFMTEVEKVEKDPDTGKRVKTKVLEYEYEPEMEDTYRSSMLKTFKKTLDDGFFPFIILDTINDRVKHFEQFWSAAKTKGFEVYVAEITADTQTCAKRNVHGRKLKDITKMSNNWESSPRHMVRLDVRSLLQDAAIEEVEMEDFNPEDVPQETKREEEEESDLGYLPKSKWEMDTSEAKLDKLDGLVSGGKRKRDSEHLSGIEDYLQLPDDYATRTSAPGKKRVRWADLEEQKDADRKRAIGFVVGQTDWEKITDESGQFAQRALNRTKYF
uniref:YLP motif-containing protein 1 n=1 Tax=Poecilia formosa TaxID=48698 RepID=A0A087XPL8_POEFO